MKKIIFKVAAIFMAISVLGGCSVNTNNKLQTTQESSSTQESNSSTNSYASYVGKWNWENSVPLKENQENYYEYDEAWVDIKNISGNDVTFEYYHQKGGSHLYMYDVCTGTIENNIVTAYTDARKSEDSPVAAQFKITLTFNDDMIYLEAYNITADDLSFSGNFYK